MQIKLGDISLSFHEQKLSFNKTNIENIFSERNESSLRGFLLYRKYSKFYINVQENYQEYMDLKLGDFLLECKERGDDFYLNFLNEYGDLAFSEFKIAEKNIINEKGLFICCHKKELKLVKACQDSFKKNINELGKVRTEDCFLDGKPEVCYINSLFNKYQDDLKFYVCVIKDKDLSNILEKKLLSKYLPEWNS
ncbi:hypothetical protein [Natronospora cellulosivora (SeqCode)]